MKRTRNPHAEYQLTQLATQFDAWRQQRATRAERIPPALWQQAVALTTMLPRSRVAKALRVSWSDLHKQCAAAYATPVPQMLPTPLHFVEVSMASPGQSTPMGTEITVQRPDGTCLHLQLRDSSFPLLALVRTFWETV